MPNPCIPIISNKSLFEIVDLYTTFTLLLGMHEYIDTTQLTPTILMAIFLAKTTHLTARLNWI